MADLERLSRTVPHVAPKATFWEMVQGAYRDVFGQFGTFLGSWWLYMVSLMGVGAILLGSIVTMIAWRGNPAASAKVAIFMLGALVIAVPLSLLAWALNAVKWSGEALALPGGSVGTTFVRLLGVVLVSIVVQVALALVFGDKSGVPRALGTLPWIFLLPWPVSAAVAANWTVGDSLDKAGRSVFQLLGSSFFCSGIPVACGSIVAGVMLGIGLAPIKGAPGQGFWVLAVIAGTLVAASMALAQAIQFSFVVRWMRDR